MMGLSVRSVSVSVPAGLLCEKTKAFFSIGSTTQIHSTPIERYSAILGCTRVIRSSGERTSTTKNGGTVGTIADVVVAPGRGLQRSKCGIVRWRSPMLLLRQRLLEIGDSVSGFANANPNLRNSEDSQAVRHQAKQKINIPLRLAMR